MKMKLKVWAFSSVIKDDAADQQEEMMALDALCGVVQSEMVLMIAKKETTKEAWDTIATFRVGDDPAAASEV
jgi:hypothetical protein